jgi:tetratricopeptide (TPR) repeat protein
MQNTKKTTPMVDQRVKMVGLIPLIVVFFLCYPASPVGAADCDKAMALTTEAMMKSNEDDSVMLWKEAVNLCPGFIRPYELIGNYYRKQGQNRKAIEFFKKASDLGSRNYKLYYLLAFILFNEGDTDGAHAYLMRSISLRADYPKSLALKTRIEQSADKYGPKIFLYDPSTQSGQKIVHQSEILTVRGTVTDKSGVSWVRVNGLNAPIDGNGNFLKDIPLKIGTSIIKVVATDRLNNQSIISVTVERRPSIISDKTGIESSSGVRALYGKSFAVVIGINNYQKWPPLEFAVADAMAVKKRLTQLGFDQIVTILDKDATQRRILTELFNELPQKATHNDRVLFYFAGHGQTEDLPDGKKKGYIIPFDADITNYSTTAISMEQIRSLSSRIQAKHIIYIMDSCYSGLGLNRSIGKSRGISDYIRKVSSMRVVQIITAGGKGEQVQEKEGHGLFTTYFLRAINGAADINRDNVVTGTELGAYLRPAVSDASRQAQTPLYGRLEGEGEFLFSVTGK